jgi:hypothetical protein
MTNRQKEILAKGHMIYEMCLEKGGFDCVLGFVDDQLKLGNADLMKVFFDQLQGLVAPDTALQKEALLEIKKRIQGV